MHPYHLGKKPHDAVEAYIEHYTSKGDLILDPFSGSGTTALAALMLGRKAVAIDISPAATFISRFYVSKCDVSDLARRFEEMCAKVSADIAFLYATVCHRCGGPGLIHYVIYSNVYQCMRCRGRTSLYEASRSRPACCPICFSKDRVISPISPAMKICGYEPVAVSFSCLGSCKPRRTLRSAAGSEEEVKAFPEIDAPRIREIESTPIPYPYPDNFMMNIQDPGRPWGDEWRPSRDFRRVSDLFSYRNLWALAAFMNAAGDDDDLKAVITAGMLAASRKAQHLREGGGYIPGNWALPPMSKQRNVSDSLRKIFGRILQSKQIISEKIRSQEVAISTQSATCMSEVPSCSVDYIFTDPPYGGAVQYAELNFVWESWLGLSTAWHDQEIVVNRSRGLTIDHWADMMRLAMMECYRILKPGRWLSLCYHDASGGTWPRLQAIMAEAGFVIGDSSLPLAIDTGSNTYNQRVNDKPVQRDLVINFRKPKPGESARSRLPQRKSTTEFHDQALSIIHDYLEAHPGSTKDSIYDYFINILLRTGQIEDHNFEKLLLEVAYSSGRTRTTWFLRTD
jgi:16S rRNA G966 N2-methylase RsmD